MSISRIIRASRRRVYQAFLDPGAVASWLAPDTMRAHVHTFEPWQGGHFRISLTYQHPDDSPRGKTTDDTDAYHGRFIQLIPDERIVEAIEFETQEPGFAGEMRMTATFTEVAGGTGVSLRYENVPVGIRREDNEAGTQQSLRKLAALVEEST
ncbi:MAG: SRPBCC domain-containing protein [Anaerolineae bacterium]